MRRMIVLVAALSVAGCIRWTGRIPLTEERQSTVAFDAEAGDVRFAADVAARYTGTAELRYEIELVQHGAVVSRATCDPDPFRATRRSCAYRLGRGNFDCSVVMSCRAHLDRAGPTLVRARLSVPERPAELVIRRADLLVGQ